LSRWLLAVAVIFVLSAATPASAQDPFDGVYAFELEPNPSSRVDVPVNGLEILRLTFRDLSRDATTTLVPGSPAADVLFHQVTFQVFPRVEDPGWFVAPPSSMTTYAGTVATVEVPFQVNAQAREVFYPVDLVATIRTTDGGTYYANASLSGFSLGARSFSAQVSQSFEAKPDEIIEAPVRLINLGMGHRTFDMEVADNPCGLGVGTQNGNLVKGKSEEIYTVSVETPSEKPYYFSDLCTVTLRVFPSGQPEIFQQVFVSITINGGYVDPTWVFNTVGLLLLLLLLLFLLARRKARIEEEILGKPQKPWTIPVEVLYLKALRQKDERAWYVVRHYLMEDEYRSSLLWYKSYKKQTKGSRKKEALVLRQEKAYEGWKRAWAKDIAKPIRKADRFDARLQRKLDRKAEKAHRKRLGKYASVRGQMEKAHAKKVERLAAQHEKAAAKARKKGLPVPAKPVVAKPDYPEEPELVPIPLAEHKWAKKSARFRARMVRKQGDLEVKFEKADARRLRKVRRKVQRLARKLDDPEFVAEHPLLQGS
jgi:hypothetical protein